MRNFKGAGKRLQKVQSTKSLFYLKISLILLKLKQLQVRLKNNFLKKLIACWEYVFIFTKEFLSHYKDSMKMADVAIVYFNPGCCTKTSPFLKKMSMVWWEYYCC